MSLPSRKKKGDWDPDEKEVLALILRGDKPFLPRLRIQIEPPFCTGVERVRWDGGVSARMHYEESLFEEYTIGVNSWIGLPCLAIRDPRYKRPLVLMSGVYKGVITGLSGNNPNGGEWPRALKIHDWCFISRPWLWSDADFNQKDPNSEMLSDLMAPPPLPPMP